MKKRIISAAVLLLIALCVNAMLAGLLALISTCDYSFIDGFCRLFSICFFAFGGGFVAAAILMLLTKIPEDKTISYGSGFYYGTLACAFVLNDYFHLDAVEVLIIVSVIISGLVTYIVWLRNNKDS